MRDRYLIGAAGVVLLSISWCIYSDFGERIQIGDKFTPAELGVVHQTEDGESVRKQDFPLGSNVEYLGNSWHRVSYNDEVYLIRNTGRSSIMSKE